MKAHIKSIHEGKKYRCTICPSQFFAKSNLKVHIGTVHEEKTYEC